MDPLDPVFTHPVVYRCRRCRCVCGSRGHCGGSAETYCGDDCVSGKPVDRAAAVSEFDPLNFVEPTDPAGLPAEMKSHVMRGSGLGALTLVRARSAAPCVESICGCCTKSAIAQPAAHQGAY
jgi:hypothetical protein